MNPPDSPRETARTAGPDGRARRGRRRLISLGVVLILIATAVIVVVSRRHDRSGGPSLSPTIRQMGGLKAVAAVTPAGYSLFTTRGTVNFLPGVDLGATTPGHQPGELAITADDYRRWLDEMGAMAIHAVRIYTIQPPAFYLALSAYNTSHADPIFLVQGVYLPNDVYLQKQNFYDPEATQPFRQQLPDAA